MAKGKYDDALAELTAHAAEIPDIVTAIKKRLSSNERSGKISLDTDITGFLKQKAMPSRDEQLEIFRQGFKTAYGLSDENYAKMSALISDAYHEKPDFMFNAQGILISERAETLVLADLGMPERKDVTFELFVDRIPEKYNGIKTLGDLIDRYSAVETGLRQKEQECQAAQSKILVYEKSINQLQADLNSLEGKIDAKYKTQIADLKVQLEKYKLFEAKFQNTQARAEISEKEMHKMIEILGKYKIDDLPPALKNKFAEIKRDFYETYLKSNSQNKLLVEVVHYNLGQVMMVYFQNDNEALPHFKKAVELADEEYRANPDPAGDAAARHDFYLRGVEACEENIRNAKK